MDLVGCESTVNSSSIQAVTGRAPIAEGLSGDVDSLPKTGTQKDLRVYFNKMFRERKIARMDLGAVP